MTGCGSSAAARMRPPWVRLTWQRADQHLLVSLLGIGALVAAGGLALMGLPPVDVHGVLHRFGIMDPLCGGTRAARYAALGQWGQAWRYNPLGILAVVIAAGITLRTVTGLLSRRWMTITLNWTPRRKRVVALFVVALAVALTVRQQLRADILVAGT